ncbi:MAG: hypothetical protein UIG52_06745 [Bacteroidales bacterium]|nr:hypothetical protein [Bacteroidales bacterium]
MDKKNSVSFIKIDVLENFRFWHKFAKNHSMLEVGKEVLAQADALMYEDESNERASSLLAEARAFSEKKRMAGALGGQKRAINAGQNVKTLPQRQTTKTAYPTKDELYDFAQENNLADGIARQFYEINESRGWKHRNGQPISNWKGALINFSKRMSNDSE